MLWSVTAFKSRLPFIQVLNKHRLNLWKYSLGDFPPPLSTLYFSPTTLLPSPTLTAELFKVDNIKTHMFILILF